MNGNDSFEVIDGFTKLFEAVCDLFSDWAAGRSETERTINALGDAKERLTKAGVITKHSAHAVLERLNDPLTNAGLKTFSGCCAVNSADETPATFTNKPSVTRIADIMHRASQFKGIKVGLSPGNPDYLYATFSDHLGFMGTPGHSSSSALLKTDIDFIRNAVEDIRWLVNELASRERDIKAVDLETGEETRA